MPVHESPTLGRTLEIALDAFWAVILEHYPDRGLYDPSKERLDALEHAATEAVKEWLERNPEE
jgi:hypothetical protein